MIPLETKSLVILGGWFVIDPLLEAYFGHEYRQAMQYGNAARRRLAGGPSAAQQPSNVHIAQLLAVVKHNKKG